VEPLTVDKLASMIDHAVLKPTATHEDLYVGCDIAHKWNVASICVRPCDVYHAVEYLKAKGSSVQVGTVVGFPHGSNTIRTKIYESLEAIVDGATEIDMVMNIGQFMNGYFNFVQNEIFQLKDAIGVKRVLKVIIECSAIAKLDDEVEEVIRKASFLAKMGAANFVKTSTGFGEYGAKSNHVDIMYSEATRDGGTMKVKASGGIRTLEDALMMIYAGASRLGTSHTDSILTELKEKQR
jgi:deoxyribose-phosphate aldolase